MTELANNILSEKQLSNRRQFISNVLRSASLLYFTSSLPAFATTGKHRLSFSHTHTGEKLTVVYKQNGLYVPEALEEINYLLRDFRTAEVHPIDPTLMDALYTLQQSCCSNGKFEIISGYRSPKTNNMLRQKSGGVAKRSMHLLGKAIDVRLPGIDTCQLRDNAIDMKFGGVGYYERSDFVHIDTGRVRTW